MSKINWPWLQKYIWPRSFRIWITGPKMWSAPTKAGMPYNFYCLKFSPSLTVEAAESGQTLFRALWPRGWGYGVTQLGTFPELRSISMPNFIKISAVVWIFIADIYVHTHTHWLLYIRWANCIWVKGVPPKSFKDKSWQNVKCQDVSSPLFNFFSRNSLISCGGRGQ